MQTAAATPKQVAYITSLINRDFWAAQPILQASYDANTGDGWQVTKGGIKHVLRKLDREQASQMIEDLKAL